MKKRIIILGSIVLLVCLAWTAGWYFITSQIRQQVEALAFADGETAPQLTCATLGIGGYPFNIDISCTDTVIVSGDVLVEFPEVRASAIVYRPTHLLASARGAAEISDAFTGQRSAVSWDGLEASLRLDNWRIARLSLIGTNVSWNDLLFGDAMIARANNVEMHLLDIPERHDATQGLADLALFARATGLDYPGAAVTAADIELESEITRLPDDLREIDTAGLIPAWQRAGGRIDTIALRSKDAGSDLEATGNLALDEAGLLNGQIDITSQGVAERIGAMIEEPLRTLVLGVPGADGRHLNQVNFRAGTVSSGLVPLGVIPPLF
ncbi:MAG: DUF2125 domain-containing protein [Devosia sp.]|jgi:hypothetical protein|uniref:DUF2125 domain-containing protein n=1 Tax=Devosia sp. TaxID=1871048 RepID=UPI0019E73FBB|nr:DUF2125 domain-containing protein [Devosia sp.]MBF0679092.1 DUF2125 domain-containing protein [Devosia sp.]